MKRRISLLVVLALAACARKESPKADAAAPAASSVATLGVEAGAVRDAASDAALSSTDRATVVRELNRGRKLARAKDWPGALAAFDKALALAPDDTRVLSEVGWAALQANDLKRADAANKRGLANEHDPKRRAAILYNTGRVAEAYAQSENAKRAYTESLSLRDNADVKKRLESLGGSTDYDPTGSLRCTQPLANVAALCACLGKHADDLMMLFDEKPSCVEAKGPSLGDARLFGVDWGSAADSAGERAHLLVVREGSGPDARVRVVADLGHDYEPGAMGIHNHAEPKGGAVRKVGERAVVVVSSDENDSDFNMGGLESCDTNKKLEVACLLSDVPGGTKCTPAIPVAIEDGCDVGVRPEGKDLDDATKQMIAEIEKRAFHAKAKATWTVDEGGHLQVRVVEGSRDLFPQGILRPIRVF